MSTKPVIIWMRNDLRLSDHPAFFAAGKRPVIPVYIYAPEEEGDFTPGEASLVWLHHSLNALQSSLKSHHASLIIRKGSSLKILQELIEETGADTVFWTRRYEPTAILRDSNVKSSLKEAGIAVQSFCGQLLFEPWTLMNKQGKPFQVFTPFWNTCKTVPVRAVLEMPPLVPIKEKVHSLDIKDLALLPKIHWDRNVIQNWTPGENGAKALLEKFKKKGVSDYQTTRDLPSIQDGVSHLSPHLHFGEISPFQIWNAILSVPEGEGFLRQIAWREFSAYLLYHFPHVVNKPFKSSFNDFKWESNPDMLKRWQKGLTGYPLVDAGMRQLWETGWMHNRVRMVVGSFLVKDLLISWEEGAKWFWDTLFDADLANNTLGWQWVGGMGADAAPYFRIFNPILQSEKFDPDGEYIKKYVPELKDLPKKWIHSPHEAPDLELRSAGIILGKNYPYPIVDHGLARKRALAVYKGIAYNEGVD